MRVEAELLDHPKFIRLKSLLGPAALEVLLRIWGHCQSCHRGGHWGLVDPWYVEAVARWAGTAGECMKALRECRFIDVSPDGRVEIHDWDVMNSHMVKAWSNGKKGGRKPGQPTPPPPQTEPPADPISDPISDLLTDPRTDGLTQAEPNLEPTGRKEGRKESRKESVEGAHTPIPTQPPAFAEAPSQADVLKAASDFQEGVGELIGYPAIHPKWAAQWWEWRGNSATRGFDTLRDWRIQLVRDWRTQARGWLLRQTEAGKNAEKAPTAWEMKQRIDALEAQIRDHPGNPDNTVGSLERKKREKPACDLLKRELKELRQQLTGVGGGQ